MTCIVGYKTPDGPILIGADSMSAYTNCGRPANTVKEPKVFKRDGFVFGGCACWRFIQIFRYSWKVPEHTEQGVEAFMFRDAIPSLRACFKEHGMLKVTDLSHEEIASDATAILAYGGELWCLYSDFSLQRSMRHYCAVGSGDTLALGALAAIERMPHVVTFDNDPGEGWMPDYEARVRLALEAAATHTPGAVCAPFLIESSA